MRLTGTPNKTNMYTIALAGSNGRDCQVVSQLYHFFSVLPMVSGVSAQ